MKIKSIETIAVEVKLPKTFGGSKYKVDKRCTIITRMTTECGLKSEIYNGDNRVHAKEIMDVINEELAPVVIGEDIFEAQRIWEKMMPVSTLHKENFKLAMEAIACVDCAVWDLRGKALGKNVSALLGGYCGKMPVMGICGYYVEGKTLADISKEVEWIRDAAGINAVKFKVGGLSPQEDAKRVAAARKGGGDDFVIAVDANRGWNAFEAIQFAHLVEPLNIRWFEEPFHWYDDLYGMARVRSKINIPVNAGQSEISGHGVRRLLTAGSVDIVNFDASEGGGITEWQRAAAMCAMHGVQMAHHEEPQIAMQMLSSIPHGTFVECFPDPDRDPVWEKMIANRPKITDGIIEVPAGPGFGLELDWDFVKKYRVN